MSIFRADLAQVLTVALIILPTSARAQSKDSLDPIAAQALAQTRERLANKAHSNAKSTVGQDPQLTDETYNLASDVLGTLMQEADGDPIKLKNIVDGLSRDPRSLERRLTPEQRQAIRDLASKAEKSRGSVEAPR